MLLKIFAICFLGSLLINTCQQTKNHPMEGDRIVIKSQDSIGAELEKYIYKDSIYAISDEVSIKIINSFPKGGSIDPSGLQYVDPAGARFAFAAFWTTITNTGNKPIELKIDFPADTFDLFDPPDSYLRLFLADQPFSPEALPAYNYGLNNIQSFLDRHHRTSTSMQKTLRPAEQLSFYVMTLSFGVAGVPRAELILQNRTFLYQMSLAPNGSGEVPCGEIIFKD